MCCARTSIGYFISSISTLSWSCSPATPTPITVSQPVSQARRRRW
jgi:hypothetical protein